MAIIIDTQGNRHAIASVTIDDYITFKSERDAHGCLIWYGKINGMGYPELTTTQAKRSGFWLVYHYTWFAHTGERVPKPLQLDHLCRVRACIDPTHLEVVTPRENVMRGNTLARKNAEKVMCPKGHPYDDINASGDRGCKTCKAANARRYRERRKERAL